jgi:hypothetical protein
MKSLSCSTLRAQGEVTTIAEIAVALHRASGEIIRVFEILGIQVANWSEPSAYRVADILESCSRHEVARRYGCAPTAAAIKHYEEE